MIEVQKNVDAADPDVGDMVKLKQDVLFWEIGGGGTDLLRSAGMEYPVCDVMTRSGIGKTVTLEDYNPDLKRAWFATIGVNDVEVVWRVPDRGM